MGPDVLRSIDPREIGRRLQEARRARGRTQQEAAEHLGVARTTITGIEKGDRRVRPGELVALAGFYGRSVGEFLRAGPPVEAFAVQLRSTLAPDISPEAEIAPATGEFQRLCEDYLELERLTGSPMTQRYPSQYEIGRTSPEDAAEDIAGAERNRLGLGDGPLPDLSALLENDVGLRIFSLRLPSRIAAMFAYVSEFGGCIAVNRNHPPERRRMSLAHDYAHFLTNRYQPTVDLTARYQRQPENERFAEAFARAFLMPAAGLSRRYHELHRSRETRLTPADLCTLAHLYFVSVEALTRRLEELRLLPSGVWDRLDQAGFRVREAQRLLGLTPHPDANRLLPARYVFLAVGAFALGDISEGQLARYLRLDRLAARDLVLDLSDPLPLSEEGRMSSTSREIDTVPPLEGA